MIREIDLINYLPLFVQEFREIQQIMNAENPEFQLIADESERIKNNQFIETSDLVGIRRFEKMLNIIPAADDTLESRISRVLSRWNDVVPYNYRALVQKLIQLCDGLNFIINPNFNEYEMEIITHLELSGQVDELQYLLGYMIPMNIAITSKNNIYCNSLGHFSLPAGMSFCTTFELSDAYKANFEVQGNSIIASGISLSSEIEVSDAYQVDFNLEGNANIAGTYVGTVEVTISDNFNETIDIKGTNQIASNTSITEVISIN